MAKASAKSTEVIRPVTIEIPMGPLDSEGGYQADKAEKGYIGDRTMHLDVRLGPKAAKAFSRLRNGLRESGAKLEDGRPVWSSAETLRFLLEALADAAR